MSVLEQLYSLEIEFHRMARSLGVMDVAGIHTSYALQQGYEYLLRSLGAVSPATLAEAKDRMAAVHDPRVAEAAYRSLSRLIAG